MWFLWRWRVLLVQLTPPPHTRIPRREREKDPCGSPHPWRHHEEVWWPKERNGNSWIEEGETGWRYDWNHDDVRLLA